MNLARKFRYKATNLFNRLAIKKHVVLSPTLSGNDHLCSDLGVKLSHHTHDYIRYAMWFLVADEIRDKGIEGQVVEAGVFEGSSAALLNRLFPERTLYLFDTFEGFDRNDLDTEVARGFSSGVQEFQNTSVDAVMSKMAYPDRCVIKKGWFPRSAEGVDDRFVFVSIDFDLYDPTIEALRFFYPKVVPGGFLFVHDYNHKKFEGIKPAVREFCAEAGVNYAPLPDSAGSVMFVKNW